MADSVVEILNTSITSNELPTSSSSHTILTTDANTSYVIKDVQANAYVGGLTAKINNFAVGDWSVTRTGSEIVDVNSTVSVSCENFPIQVQQLRTSIFSTSTFSAADELFGHVNGTQAVTTTKVLGPSNPFTSLGTTYCNTILTVNGKIYQLAANNNNIRRLYYWSDISVTSPTTLTTVGYGLLCLAEDQDAIFYQNGSTNALQKITLSTGVVTTVKSARWPLPDSQSTYERSAYCNGWLFEQPQNGQRDSIYAFNSSTGIYIKFSNLATMTDYSSGSVLGVSYDKATDKFYVYRFDSNASTSAYCFQDILPLTKTQMDANVSDTTNNTSSTRNFIANWTTVFSRNSGYFADNIVGSPTVGDIFYLQKLSEKGNVYECDFINKTETLYAKKSSQGTINAGAFLSAITPNASQTETLGFSYPPNEIQLRITGVKTTA